MRKIILAGCLLAAGVLCGCGQATPQVNPFCGGARDPQACQGPDFVLMHNGEGVQCVSKWVPAQDVAGYRDAEWREGGC